MTEITMLTSDGQKLKAKFEAMKVCKPVEEFFKDNKPDVEIPLPKVSSGALAKVIKFCEYYQSKAVPKVEKPLKTNKLDAIFKDEFLLTFMNMPTPELYELLMASDFLVHKELEELIGCTIASKIVGKTVEDIRKDFTINNDLTAAEEKEIKEFFQWSEELWPSNPS